LSKELREMLPIVVFKESFTVMDSQWVSKFFSLQNLIFFTQGFTTLGEVFPRVIAVKRSKCSDRKVEN
jgi:hypothetical protein